MIPWIDVFGEGADEEDQIDEIDDFVGELNAYLVSFTTDAANRIARNAGEGNGLKPGDDCAASTTPRRPCDAWRSFSRFRTHRVVSEFRIWELHWKIGS